MIRVPQFTDGTLTNATSALAWDGAVGGVLALDIQNDLALGGATVNLNGLGFRGATGRTPTGFDSIANQPRVGPRCALANPGLSIRNGVAVFLFGNSFRELV